MEFGQAGRVTLIKTESIGKRLEHVVRVAVDALSSIFCTYDGIKEWAKVERVPLHGGLYDYQRR